MLRDVPRIYLIFVAFAMALMILLVSYINGFIRGGDTLTLNDIILTSAVSEIDELSRINTGTLVLEDTFEEKAWKELSKRYPKDSEVKFDYYFEDEDNSWKAVANGIPRKKSSKLYTVGGSVTPNKSDTAFSDTPVKAIRIRVRKTGDKVVGDVASADTSDWTYTATVKLDVVPSN